MGIQINGQTDTISAFDNNFSLAGNVSIGGTLTYEDVTSVDAVGLSTFQAGIRVTGGSVGIGTDNPGTPLHVFHENINEVARFESNDATCYITFSDDSTSESGTLRPLLGAKGNDMFFQSGGSERLRITSAGLVGIGTDNPLETLHIGTGANHAIRFGNATYGYKLRANISATNDYGFYIEDKDGNDVYRATSASGTNDAVNTHKFYTSGVERIGITSTGRIEQKSNNEDIDMDAAANGQLKLDGNGYNAALALNSQGLNIYHNSASRGIIFGTNETERLRIASDGKIGINNNAPLYAMHFKNGMSSSPSFIHMEVTGSNTVGGGGGIAFDTSASNALSNNGLYLATISGVRNSADDGSNDLVFKTSKAGVAGDDGNTHSPKERLRITSGGEVQIANGNLKFSTAGTGIDFSANANAAGMTSELLDDYEEGTFLPTMFGSTAAGSTTYSLQYGYYVKVGKLVHFQIRMTVASSTATGHMRVGGLPFVALNDANRGYASINVSYANNITLPSGPTWLGAYTSAGDSHLVLIGNTPGNVIQHVSVDTSWVALIGGTYIANV